LISLSCLKIERKNKKAAKIKATMKTKAKDTREYRRFNCKSLDDCETVFKGVCVEGGQNLILQEVTNVPFTGNNVVMPAAAAFVPNSKVKEIMLYTAVIGHGNNNADRTIHPDRTLPTRLLDTYGANKGLDSGTILLFTSNKPCLTPGDNEGCSKWVPDFAETHNVNVKVFYFNPVSFDRQYLKENYDTMKKMLFVSGKGYNAKVVANLIRAYAADYYTENQTAPNERLEALSKIMNFDLDGLNATTLPKPALNSPVANEIVTILLQLTTSGFTATPTWARMVKSSGVVVNDIEVVLLGRYAYFYNYMFSTKKVSFEWLH
jgi:hypothetical protein